MKSYQAFRLDEGRCLDRNRILNFRFNGQTLSGYAGDTLASALLANGVRVVGRGFKYHRPRGIMSAGAEECNALVTIGRGGFEEPNVRATLQPLYDGLEARSQNCWPGVNFDTGRLLDYLHFLWPAGFYNKTFIWPKWHCYEGMIRNMAGLGKLPPEEDPDYYIHRHVSCDVLVVGSGPAGLAAALAAGEKGKRVILLEQGGVPGGSLWWRPGIVEGEQADQWVNNAVGVLKSRRNTTLLTNTTASAWFDHHMVIASERITDTGTGSSGNGPRERLWHIHPGQTILATGGIEQPLVFANNDRPGIMLCSSVQEYCARFGVAAGRKVVVATNNDSAYDTVESLQASGVDVTAVIDSRPEQHIMAVNRIRDRGITVLDNAIPVDCRGDKGVRNVTVQRQGEGKDADSITIACDCIAMAGGWQPAVHLFTQARGKLRYDSSIGAFVPDRVPGGIHVAGMTAGALTLDDALQQGWEAGLRASGRKSVNVARPNAEPRDGALRIKRVWSEYRPARQWIDFQHDVTLQDIDIAIAENYTSVEHLKRYTTTGMSVDQGKTSNINALVALAEKTGRQPGEVGTTTFRPFYMPVTLGALAGRSSGAFYSPIKKSPLDRCHRELGGVFDDYGDWQRPKAFPRGGESEQEAREREAEGVRSGVSLFDNSPLGKIEVRGPDAAEFLNRIYVNNIKTLKPGRVRYGLMLNENGIVIDDGICARLDEDYFLVHTTSSGMSQVYGMMELLLQTDWPDLRVLLTPVSGQWATVAVSGPLSRMLTRRLVEDINLSPDEFPHMSIRTGTFKGFPLRIMRVSFTGELCYEISVPAGHGETLWTGLLENGRDLDVVPIGIESLMVLRIEKGNLHVGSDTDGYTTPLDLGWGGIVEKKSTDFLGKRSLSRPFNRTDDRLQLVGLRPAEEGGVLIAGSHVIDAECGSAPAPTMGYVTSACYSPNLKRYVALGLVRNGGRLKGTRVNIYNNGSVCPAMIGETVSWDPEGERLYA